MSKEGRKDYSREELISFCEQGVVPFRDWCDRDSYIAQSNLDDMYLLLKAGCEFNIDYSYDERIIGISFDNITKEQKDYFCSNFGLDIDSRDAYLEEFGYGEEMFDAYGYDTSKDRASGYIPNQERLDYVAGGDWY